MCTRRRQVLIASFCLVVLLVCAEGYGQIADRTSIVINEISPTSASGDAPWIEFFNPLSYPVALAGKVVRRNAADSFEVPAGFPSLQSGAFLVVWFDAEVPGDVGFTVSGSLVTVHAPESLAGTWLPERGELALYDRGAHGSLVLIDYVAWGAPGRPWSRTPERFALWRESEFVLLAESFGVYDSATTLASRDSIGRYPGAATSTARDWAIYAYSDEEADNEVTPGTENKIPKPKVFNLPSGANVSSSGLAIAWPRRRGDESYHFQLARDEAFAEIVVDAQSEFPVMRIGFDLKEGKHFYRAMACSGRDCSIWSPISFLIAWITSCRLPGNPLPSAAALDAWVTGPNCSGHPDCKIIESIQLKFSRKDSRLRCTGGCDPSHWDRPHKVCQSIDLSAGTTTAVTKCTSSDFSPTCEPGAATTSEASPDDHGNENCARASISMIASAYGACLSQDRIAYEMRWRGAAADEHLAHSDAAFNCGWQDENLNECTRGLKWALSFQQPLASLTPADLIVILPSAIGNPIMMPPSWVPFSWVRYWIDHDRPIMIRQKVTGNYHLSVLAGYCVERSGPFGSTEKKWLFMYDPAGGPIVVDFTTWKASSEGIWVAPSVTKCRAPHIRRDELSMWEEYDASGAVKFDKFRWYPDAPPTSP